METTGTKTQKPTKSQRHSISDRKSRKWTLVNNYVTSDNHNVNLQPLSSCDIRAHIHTHKITVKQGPDTGNIHKESKGRRELPLFSFVLHRPNIYIRTGSSLPRDRQKKRASHPKTISLLGPVQNISNGKGRKTVSWSPRENERWNSGTTVRLKVDPTPSLFPRDCDPRGLSKVRVLSDVSRRSLSSFNGGCTGTSKY